MNDRPRHSRARNISLSSGNVVSSGPPLRRHKPDYWILILTSLLLGIGLVVVYSISPGLAASQNISQGYFITKQLIAVLIGLATFALAAYLPTSFWARMIQPLVVASVIGSVIVMFTPVDNVYDAHRWIKAAGFSFQVAELIKLALLLWAAGFLAERWREGRLADYKATLRPIIIVLLAVGVVVAKFQSDLGSAAVIVAIMCLMAFSAGVPFKKIALIGGLILILGSLAIVTSDYRRDRLYTFVNPEADCVDRGYQACQALRSVGSGGLLGLGLGYSVQAYGYLPEASDDSIFAIIAEKFGFIGSFSLIVVYGVFITRLKSLIERLNDQFTRLIVVGVLAWLSTQMIINVGAMIGLLPLKGITLPLISQGGTSLIFLTAALGIVFNISRYTNYNATEPTTNSSSGTGNSSNGRRIGRSHNPNIVARPRA